MSEEFVTKLQASGKITIPRNVRVLMGLKDGDMLRVKLERVKS